MARDRRRARRQRRANRPQGASGDPGSAPNPTDHLSGEVEEFEAGLVAGAAESEGVDEAVDEVDADFEEEEELGDEAEGPAAADRATADEALGRPQEPERREGNRVLAFLRASWAELQRVQWPDRRHTAQGTAVTLGFVVLAGAYLGLLDAGFSEVIDFIL